MDLGTWGPVYWKFLHTVSFVYPTKPSTLKRKEAYTFLHAFGTVIPCVQCRSHFMEMLARDVKSHRSPHLETRESFSRYLILIHNEVNKRLSKPELKFENVCTMFNVDPYDEPSLCAIRASDDAALTAEAVAAHKKIQLHRARWSAQSTTHDFTLLIGCAVGVFVVCVLMIVYGVLAGKAKSDTK